MTATFEVKVPNEDVFILMVMTGRALQLACKLAGNSGGFSIYSGQDVPDQE